jgi:hypothetical protein
LFFVAHCAEAAPQDDELRNSFSADFRSMVARYCQECHAEEFPEADLNLIELDSWDAVRRETSVLQRVDEMLASGQMPPRDATQPTAQERTKLQAWVRGYLTFEAKARAGDPGPVVLRRLNNAQYTYTLRDITGVASLDPAREFPADGAAGEGFTNTGGALVMSPSLVTKYLDAAKGVASHAVLLPDGFRFSPYGISPLAALSIRARATLRSAL